VTVHEPPNTPPTITDIDDQDNIVGDHVTLQVDADDPDGDDLTYAADGLPPGIDIDPATGEITGTIDQGAEVDSPYTVDITVTDLDGATGEITGTIDEGAEVDSPYTVDITVTDSDGATATTSFQWTVNPANTDPVTVDVDILPRCIVNDGHGVTPVVIFGNDSVAADQIDPATVELEGMPVQRFFGWFMAIVHDVDGDGFDDLFVLIDDVAMRFPPRRRRPASPDSCTTARRSKEPTTSASCVVWEWDGRWSACLPTRWMTPELRGPNCSFASECRSHEAKHTLAAQAALKRP
jgi:hypothetical protein